MNKYASESLCNILGRLFPREETIIIDGGTKDCFMLDSNGEEIGIYSPLNLSISVTPKIIPEFEDENSTVELVISIPYTSPLIKCLNPTKNESSIFEAQELVFNASISPMEIGYKYEDEEKGECNDNLSEFVIGGTYRISLKPHIFNENIEIKVEHTETLEKHLTLWALGTKEGEQSLEKYLEKTAEANGTSL